MLWSWLWNIIMEHGVSQELCLRVWVLWFGCRQLVNWINWISCANSSPISSELDSISLSSLDVININKVWFLKSSVQLLWMSTFDLGNWFVPMSTSKYLWLSTVDVVGDQTSLLFELNSRILIWVLGGLWSLPKIVFRYLLSVGVPLYLLTIICSNGPCIILLVQLISCSLMLLVTRKHTHYVKCIFLLVSNSE